jgi:hypothetical protein
VASRDPLELYARAVGGHGLYARVNDVAFLNLKKLVLALAEVHALSGGIGCRWRRETDCSVDLPRT